MMHKRTYTLDDYEWDSEKSSANLVKHGVRFADAAAALEDALAITAPDLGLWPEQRWVTLGLDRQERLLVVVHVERGERVRLISARRATARERKQYEEGG